MAASNGSAAAIAAAASRSGSRVPGFITLRKTFGSTSPIRGSVNRNAIRGQTSVTVCALSRTISQASRRASGVAAAKAEAAAGSLRSRSAASSAS